MSPATSTSVRASLRSRRRKGQGIGKKGKRERGGGERACDVVCPLDTAAVTELWRLEN